MHINKRQHKCTILHSVNEDLNLLDILTDSTEHPSNIIYLVKALDHNAIYDTDELEKLSDEIHIKTNRKRNENVIFRKLFLLPDDQVPVRVGMCLLDSLIRIMDRIHEKVQLFAGYMNDKQAELFKNQDLHINCFETLISNSGFNIWHLRSQKSNRVKIKQLSKLLREEIEKIGLLVGIKISKCNKTCQLDKKIENRLDVFLKNRKSFSKKEQFLLNNRCTQKESSARLTRSITKELSSSKGSTTTRALGAQMGISLTRRSNNFCRNDDKEIAKDVYAEVNKFFNNFVDSYTDDLAEFLRTISNERSKRAYSLNIHEWKTVSMRNKLVKGFGCVGNIIYIYLKNDDEDEKRSVSYYVKNYLNDPPGMYQMRIQYKQRRITLFSNLEQGSKINRKETVKRTDDPRKYGSLGMFLEDKKGTYFFTTCAHVIGEEEHAYSPDDDSKLGRNVFIHHSESNTNDKNDPYIDFSLVQVSPERTLTCTFGLKTAGGDFINGRIFKGDLSEILNEYVYKWGATEPYLRKGKCIGFEDEGSFLYLMIDTKDFAKGGDSGAIVCVGEDVETGLAAFVIVAGSTDDSDSDGSTSGSSYLVYKVSDALDRIDTFSGMTPCLNPHTILISSSVSDSKLASSKR
ncbi:unnamed protein product [Mytilus coruscus]|uniref:Uncharacterized protein n=1 Tax=Mytilus coruscus TaxID=42192 RepID=A0A6J7ZVT9_MYTCO|nr:unnamed protein product [Mytilus coruscus]